MISFSLMDLIDSSTCGLSVCHHIASLHVIAANEFQLRPTPIKAHLVFGRCADPTPLSQHLQTLGSTSSMLTRYLLVPVGFWRIFG